MNRFKKDMVVLFTFLFCFLSVFSCRTNTDEGGVQTKDSSLKTLIIKHSGTSIKNLSSPIEESITVQLTKNVTTKEYIEILVVTNEKEAKVIFDNDPRSRTSKKYTDFVSEVNINVKNGNSTTKYKITFLPKKQEDAILQSLIVKQGNENIDSFNKPASGMIDENISVELDKKITDADFVEITCSATVNAAVIEIDNERISTKKYTSLPSKPIKIKVTNGANVATHNLTLTEYVSTTPQDPLPPNEYTLKCNVIDSVGGTNVEGVKIEAYEAGNSAVVETKNTDVAGNAYFNVPKGKSYDFVLSKKGRAASRVENVFVNSKEFLSIPMREWAKGTKAMAPVIGKVELFNRGDNHKDTINSNTQIDLSTLTDNHYLYLTTTSPSGEIIPLKDDSSGIFSISMNIGSPFSCNEGYGLIRATNFIQSDNKLVVEENDGSLKQFWGFSLNGLMIPNGKATIHFICYDQAGNRCERQEIVTFNHGNLQDGLNTKNRFHYFVAESKRYYRSLKSYGMPNEEGSLTSCNVRFTFNLNERIDIGRVDIYRRPYEEGNISEHWEKVCTKQYEKGYQGYTVGLIAGVSVLSDDSGDLQEGKTYQYKLVAYTERGKIESNVATLRIMEAFNLRLTSPSHRKPVNLKDVENLDFSFKISDPTLWNKKRADYFAFDVLVTKDMTYPTGSTEEAGVCFASKCKYYFNRLENDAFYVSDNAGYTRYQSKFPKETKLSDLINYKNGLVTLKANFMNAGKASLGMKGLKETIKEAGMYYWDVQSFYQNDPLNASENKAAYFAKEYPFLNSKTGEKIQGKVSTSYSYANIDTVSGAVNGMSLFIVKD